MSNAGLGSVSGRNSNDPSLFYNQIGEYAKEKGVTVHIVTLIGTECNIDAICPVAEATNGEIERVDPKDINANFQDFLSHQVLATKVVLKVKLHKGLEFRNEQPQNLNADKTILTKDFGNVTARTDITFEYQLKSVKELLKMTDIDITKIQAFHFQAQINYTALDGSKQVRVITEKVEVSNEKEELREKADYEILGMNAVQQSSKYARVGDYTKAQVLAKAWDNVMYNAPVQSVNQQMQA